MPERTLTVRIIGDDRSLQQAFKRGERSGKQFEVGVAGLGATLTRSLLPAAAAVLGVQKAFSVLGQSVDDASAINEEVSKSAQVFGASSNEVVAWSDTTARAIGVSKRAALEATGIFGNLFATVELAPEVAAEMSRSLVTLAADLASFNNASPEDVLEAIRSGLIGEAEPLRRYGVLLSESRVQQAALAATGKDNVKSLTDQEKAQARYNIILEDTVAAQGDFQRTSEGLANQSRILKAQLADLSAELGNNLLPTVLKLVRAANALFDAFDGFRHGGGLDLNLEGADLETLQRARDQIAGLTGDTDLLVIALDKAIERLNAIAPASPNDRAGPRGPGAITASNARVDAANAERAARAATAARRRSQEAFDEFQRGLDLKFDRQRLAGGTGLAALRELEAAILRRIRAEGRTFKLVRLLTDTRLRISAILESEATSSSTRITDAWENTLDALSLKLDIARTTRGFADDLRALRAIEAQILKQIAAEGRTTDLMRRLFENRQEQAQTLNDARNAAQFEALGLTAEGDRPVAGRGALLRRARDLREQIKGTVLDTPRTNRQLDAIVRVLTDKTKAVGREVRRAILDMLNDIAGAFDEGGDSGGPLTTFAKRGVNKLIEGLGLSPEQTKEIRQRFSQFGRLDLGGGGGGSRPPGRTVTPRTEGAPRTGAGERDVTVNVYIDGQKVEATVTRRQQKKRGRNAPQRRGVNPGARR